MVRLGHSDDKDYAKTLEYANTIIDNLVNNQLYRVGEKDHYENIFEIESPFVSRWDKILGRASNPYKDPFYDIKESGYSYCDMGENTGDFIHELKELKELFPKTKEDREKIDFDKQEEIFKTQFGERYTAYNEEEKAQTDLWGKVVQINIRDNVSQAFDEQLNSHINALELQKSKDELEAKKNEIKERLDQRRQEKESAPVSGTVVADIIAQDVIKDRERHKEKVESGVLSKEDKEPTLSYKETNELAKKIQRNIAQQRQDK